jgi:cell division protein FtsQ
MFTADLAGALDRIRAYPLVSAAQIERSWPSTIHIRIAERQPWGTWQQQGVKYTIDRDGVVLGTTIPAPTGSPVIQSSEQGSRIQGDHVDVQAIQATAEIYQELPQQLGTQVAEVAFLAGKGVKVTTTDGRSALFGDSSGIAYKIAAWAAMAKEADREGISYSAIDLRAGNRPVLIP